MFGISVKSVPGCLVLIEPRLIGVPVAFTPGLGPQAEVLTVVPAVEVLPPVDVLPPLALLLLELLLLPHPARTVSPMTVTSTRLRLMRCPSWNILTDLSSSSRYKPAPGW